MLTSYGILSIDLQSKSILKVLFNEKIVINGFSPKKRIIFCKNILGFAVVVTVRSKLLQLEADVLRLLYILTLKF